LNAASHPALFFRRALPFAIPSFFIYAPPPNAYFALMISPVLMPQLGDTDSAAYTLEKWLRAEGEIVRKGQPLFIAVVGKTSLEVEAVSGGTLRKILFRAGEHVTVGTSIALIGPAKSKLPAALTVRRLKPLHPVELARVAEHSLAPPSCVADLYRPVIDSTLTARDVQLPPSPIALPREGLPRMSPRARRRAKELLVPLQALQLPVAGKRITEREVVAIANAFAAIPVPPPVRQAAYAKGMTPASLKLASAENPALTEADILVLAAEPIRLPAERVALNPLKRAVAENMAYAQHYIPQFSVDMLVLAEPLFNLRKDLKRRWSRREQPSIDDFFIRALGIALSEDRFKAFRGLVDGNDVVYRGEINVGFAVTLGERGVIAPVVKGADRLALKEIACYTKELLVKARRKNLKTADYSEGLMTVSNMGMLPVDSFRAIVRPGESAILAVPGPHPRFVTDAQGEGLFGPEKAGRTLMAMTWQLSLSADHRLMDGVLAAHFLLRIKNLIEAPGRLI